MKISIVSLLALILLTVIRRIREAAERRRKFQTIEGVTDVEPETEGMDPDELEEKDIPAETSAEVPAAQMSESEELPSGEDE